MAAEVMAEVAVMADSWWRIFHGGGFRHGGFGFGYWGPGYDYPYGYAGYDDETVCYVARRRVMTRHGWRIRPVEICS